MNAQEVYGPATVAVTQRHVLGQLPPGSHSWKTYEIWQVLGSNRAHLQGAQATGCDEQRGVWRGA